MEHNPSTTLEEALFEKMGVSVDDMIGLAADAVDNQASRAADAGIPVSASMDRLSGLVEKLLQPQTLKALETLVNRLPEIATLVERLDDLPGALAAVGDTVDEEQQRLAEQGIDTEQTVINSIRMALTVGNSLTDEQIKAFGSALSDPNVRQSVIAGMGALSRSVGQHEPVDHRGSIPDRVGFLGMFRALRNPDVQRSMAIALRFAESFGKNTNAPSGR